MSIFFKIKITFIIIISIIIFPLVVYIVEQLLWFIDNTFKLSSVTLVVKLGSKHEHVYIFNNNHDCLHALYMIVYLFTFN